jgi:hypothetical protein
MDTKRFELDPRTIKLLQVIESSDHDDQRRDAIMDLATTGGMNAARILIETFERSMWRSTKFSIIQALGRVRHERATEFLCHLALANDDFAMAAEAILALGITDDPVAGEFLASIVRTTDHPLIREALTALGNMNFFPCEKEICGLLQYDTASIPASVLQSAVIAAGIRGFRSVLGDIKKLVAGGSSGPLFNSALITLGRIGDQSTLDWLEGLDTRYRAFAHQLKISAIDHLRLLSTYTIEDAVGASLNATLPSAMRQAWQTLSAFPAASAREALQLLVSEGTAEFKAMERLTLFNSGAMREDLKFLAASGDSIRREVFAALGRLHVVNAAPDKVLTVLTELGEAFTVKFLSLVFVERGGDVLLDILSSSKVAPSLRTAAINAVVLQPLMSGGRAVLRDSIGKRLVKLAEAEADTEIGARLVRAVGQIRYFGPDASNLLRERLKSGGTWAPGIYAALARCDVDDSTKMITKRLRQIIAQPDSDAEARVAIRSLARCSVISEAGCLAQISEKQLDELKGAVLKILCTVSVPELTPFVAKCLAEKDFQTRLMGVVAAKLHHDEGIFDDIFKFLDHESPSIAGRALDTLTTAGGAREHLRLLKRLETHVNDLDLYKKIFRSLTPRAGESYKEVLVVLEGLIQGRRGVLADQDLFQSALNLRDNLVFAAGATGVVRSKAGKTNLTEKERHVVDKSLDTTLKGFANYSETVKSVLRSGEVTWQHPELFDARVDKSTVIVQYVKSIDLLMQEKIGSQMFLTQGADFLQKMQSRVARLELDDEVAFGDHLVTELDCSMYFSRDSFPTHKLATICRSVMTGLIMKEQYRVVDGLRAWAVLMLIFGRTFKFRGQVMAPLFPLAKSTSDGIGRIARAMNDLQDARNRAAHRGTILEKENMQEIRDLCAALLNDLDAHLVAKA